MEKPNFKKMCLMYIQQLTNFPYIEKDFDALTDYQLLCKVVAYLNKIMVNENKQNETITALYNAFVELKDYVDNYFDNLDLQDEVNNKLDEMVEDGTLEEIISTYIGSTCEFIFPGQWGVDKASGNSNIVKIGNKVLLFDTNSQTVYSYLINMLEENNITHIDYLILTHFDSDHRGNIIPLINDGYMNNKSTYIHPNCLVEIYGSAVKNVSDAIDELCEEKGITNIIPEENQVIEITNELSLRFGNVDDEYTLAHYSNPNMASMITEVNHRGFCSLMMGDALTQTEQYLVNSQFIKNAIGLYTIPHHAIESTCYTPFYDLINPKYAVAQSSLMNYNINLFTTNQSSALLEEKGCVNYFGFNNENNIKFKEINGNIICTSGVPLAHVGQAYNNLDIYCDIEHYDETRQDGSEQYPFKDLPQALGILRDWNNQHITIHLKNGTYGVAYTGTNTRTKNICHIYNRKNYIEIIGESTEGTIIENGFYIANSNNVFIRNLTIKPYGVSGTNYCLYSIASKVLIVDCKFLGKDLENLKGYGIQTAVNSEIICTRNEFTYLEEAYRIRGDSKLITTSDLISNLTKFITYDLNNSINIGVFNGNSDFTTVTDFTDSTYFVHSNPAKINQTVTDVMLGAISLLLNTNNNMYKHISFDYEFKYNSFTVGRGHREFDYKNISSLVLSDYNVRNDNTIDVYTAVLTLNGNTLTISRNTCCAIASNGTLTSHNPSQDDDTSYGLKITNISLY